MYQFVNTAFLIQENNNNTKNERSKNNYRLTSGMYCVKQLQQRFFTEYSVAVLIP